MRSEDDFTTRGRRYQRGHFDLVVFDPCFLDECGENYILRKGQKWELLRPFLVQRPTEAAPAALFVFELMFLRDPFWRREGVSRGMKTLTDVLGVIEQDCAKATLATKPEILGFRFSRGAEMLVFDSALAPHAAAELRNRMPVGAKLVSAALDGQR